ncbi:START domain-containing protein [Robertkochia aurantiaca]|uniref:START domain-containing protein n=1 Tax=Robertkochia aurantiaca TaxID=2873700 RepID=UPI001CCB05CF|nr:START domain-containing protein [Robertkochia sp. 3YJGBD-33]
MRTTLFIICLLTVFIDCRAQSWDLRKHEKDIRVFTRKLDTTDINEYKAVMVANTSAAHALQVITDADNLWQWNAATKSSKLVRKISDNELILYIRNDLPWPIRDREHVCHITISKNDDKEFYITIDPAKESEIPSSDEVIRISNFKGHWSIRELDPGKVEITQQLYGDPNGPIPAWLLNACLTEMPLDSFRNLKLILEN